MPYLQKLKLHRFAWHEHCPHPSTFRTFSAFPTLHTLELYHCGFPSFKTFCRTVSAIPRLLILRIGGIHWPANKPEVSLITHHCQRPALVVLIVDSYSSPLPGFHPSDLFRWLSTSPTSRSIRSITLPKNDNIWLDIHFIEFLRVSASVLTSLECLEVTAGMCYHITASLVCRQRRLI